MCPVTMLYVLPSHIKHIFKLLNSPERVNELSIIRETKLNTDFVGLDVDDVVTHFTY
jgi:hypothetical protein